LDDITDNVIRHGDDELADEKGVEKQTAFIGTGID
jgi:hypothetical protein